MSLNGGTRTQPQAVIRHGTADDAEALAAFAERIFRETFAADNRPEDLEQYVGGAFGEAIQKAELSDPARETLLLDVGGALAGYAQLHGGPPPASVGAPRAVELRRFYIDRVFQGRGFAQSLMAAVVRAAAARDIPSIWLGVWERNARAVAFYRKVGFLDVGSHVFVLGTDEQTDRLMLRPLASRSSPLRAPECVYTARLVLRRPVLADADAMFMRYAGDVAVTKYVGWPRHRTPDDTRGFLAFSDEAWSHWPAGPYLVFDRERELLLGSTGLAFETASCAATGYVLATDAWGRGYATEALGAMVDVARTTGVQRLYALCHPDHRASARVLEKAGFAREATLERHIEFPNLSPGAAGDALCYARALEPLQ